MLSGAMDRGKLEPNVVKQQKSDGSCEFGKSEKGKKLIVYFFSKT